MENRTPTMAPTPTTLDCLVPLEFKPKAKSYSGRLLSREWDVTHGKNEAPKKDLVLKIQFLDEMDETGQPYVVEQRYNMLPRGRGISDLKKHFRTWVGCKDGEDFPAKYLANLSLLGLENKPVVVKFEMNIKNRSRIELTGFFTVSESNQNAAEQVSPQLNTPPQVLPPIATPAAPVVTTAPVSTT